MLVNLRRMNADEHNIAWLMERGLTFDKEKQFSADFVILIRYGECLWEAPWLVDNRVFAWHKDDNPELIKEAIRKGEVTGNEIRAMHDKGLNPFKALK